MVLMQTHDGYAKHILSDPELAADLLRNYLDPGLAEQLDLDRLAREPTEYVDDRLGKRVGDLRYSVPLLGDNRRAEVFLIMEHQSTPDPFFCLRALRYIADVLAACAKALGKPSANLKKLPYVIVVVLYNGKKPWRHLPAVRELVAAVPRGLESSPYLDFPLYLIDLAAISKNRIRGHPAVRALLLALQAAAAGKLSERRFDQIVAELTKAYPDFRVPHWLTAFMSYALCHGRFANGVETAIDIAGKYIGRKEATDMTATIAEELMRKGREEGREEGEAKAIVMTLRTRFGAVPRDVVKKIKSRGDPDVLESLIVQAVTCSSLDEFKRGLR
jgi:predicted transposase YdaD